MSKPWIQLDLKIYLKKDVLDEGGASMGELWDHSNVQLSSSFFAEGFDLKDFGQYSYDALCVKVLDSFRVLDACSGRVPVEMRGGVEVIVCDHDSVFKKAFELRNMIPCTLAAEVCYSEVPKAMSMAKVGYWRETVY